MDVCVYVKLRSGAETTVTGPTTVPDTADRVMDLIGIGRIYFR